MGPARLLNSANDVIRPSANPPAVFSKVSPTQRSMRSPNSSSSDFKNGHLFGFADCGEVVCCSNVDIVAVYSFFSAIRMNDMNILILVQNNDKYSKIAKIDEIDEI